MKLPQFLKREISLYITRLKINYFNYISSKHQYSKDSLHFEEFKQQFEKTFEKLEIEYCQLSQKEYIQYKKQWVRAFTPKNADKRKIKRVCLKYNFLWHIFSYEYLNADIQKAQEFYDVSNKDECIIISNWNALGYKLKNANSLTSEVLNEFPDVTVTAFDFYWTYSKTHEESCGPYYYKK